MYAMDLAYGDYEQELTRERQKVPFVATVASIALSSSGAVITNSATQQILAAVDTGLKGTTEAYGKEILIDKTIEVIQSAMRANRTQIRSDILVKLGRSDSEYPLELALSDVEKYFRAGTLTGGFLGVSEASAERIAEVRAREIDTVTRFGADDATTKIRGYWERGGSRAEAEIKRWLQAKDVFVPITIFINGAGYATLRAEMVNDFGL